jgi:glycosyltransferase involved in cell wall biosynthesis
VYYIHALWVGGAETIVTKYLLNLKKSGEDVTLVVNEKVGSFLEEELQDYNINIIALQPRLSHDLIGKCCRKLYRTTVNYEKKWNIILKELEPDVLHIHTSVELLKNIEFPPSKMVYTFHGTIRKSIDIRNKKNLEILESLVQSGMSFFGLSSRMIYEIKELFHTDNVYYTPNGIELSAIKDSGYNRISFCQEYGIPKDAFILGQVGRFNPVKNQHRTVDIFSEIYKREKNAYLVFVGEGNNEYFKDVKKEVVKLGLENNVLFMGIRKDATNIMNVFDALILPSISESFSLVLIEAQAQGIRAIASDVVPDEVVCNSNCLTLSLDDTDEKWADYILGNYEMKHEYQLNSFSMDYVIAQMIRYYKEIAER